MCHFVQQGGKVDQIPRGTSGKEPGAPPTYLAKRLFTEPRETRTFVPEVIAAIEARRLEKLKRPAKPRPARPSKPRRKIIYDDFGEPLRRVWVEE
jgi:hypothetical protein